MSTQRFNTLFHLAAAFAFGVFLAVASYINNPPIG